MSMIGGTGQSPVALRLAPPILVIRADIGAVPTGKGQAGVFRRLLELNAEDLVHSAYGLEGSSMVLSAALELDNLDPNELEAVLADVDMALAKHIPELRKLSQDS